MQFLCRSLIIVMVLNSTVHAAEHRFFVGTYTRGASVSEGIYASTFNDETGEIAPPELAAKADNPSFLAMHPTKALLFACIETNDFGGEATGAVAAYHIDRTSGKLTLINQQPTGGGAPCHANVYATGRFLLVANYLGGNVVVFPIEDDGMLANRSCLIQHIGNGPNKRRQESPHAHSINLSADNRFAYAADLGIDRILIYRFDEKRGLLIPSVADSVAVKPGSGPRHFCIHPSGQFAYANSELTCEATAFARNPATGGLKVLQTISTLPEDFEGRKSTAECLTHPSGRFLYVSNRGHDSIAVYAIDAQSGELKRVQIAKTTGQEPRNFVFDPTGRWLIAENQNSDTIVTFAIDQTTGELSPTDKKISVGKPVCIRFERK